MDRLLDAIAKVESRSDPNAVGDGGRALGVYQIHRRYWQDGTRVLGVDWEYRDAQDPEKARQVVRAYLGYYGRGKSLLDMARIHNGGPQGHRVKATQEYARRIAVILDGNSTPRASRTDS
jgi:soluble lytic murein transglycosylase-like protein